MRWKWLVAIGVLTIVDKAALLTKVATLLSTLAVGPLGLLAPFVHLGALKEHPCDIQSIGE